MPGITTETGTSKYNAIPGPLGPASNSLEGKVALVTGAGKWSQNPAASDCCFAKTIEPLCIHRIRGVSFQWTSASPFFAHDSRYPNSQSGLALVNLHRTTTTQSR
jgi:hypothetical protein